MTLRLAGASALALASSTAFAQSAPIVHPGAPGAPSQVISPEQAIAVAGVNYAPGDVAFMQGMIVHHQQAVEMAKLVAKRTNNEAVVATADRIEAGQADEMKFMREWLETRGEPIKMAHMDHAGHTMMGMASAADMAELARLSGTAFDRKFLQLMIAHHKGAVDMVEQLHRQPGTAYEPTVYAFTNEVVSDQQAEIKRMNALLAKLSTDPRATLAAGFRDAGEAISNMRLVAAQGKAPGFFDPDNPAQLQPRIESGDEKAESTGGDADEGNETDPQFGQRGSLLTFWNTDMAFKDDLLVTGSYHGFNIYRLGQDGVPALVSSTVCPGGQGDVSLVGDLLIMSVEDSKGRVDCGLQGVPEKVSKERLRGLRIFDISDVTRPRQVGIVQTCRGSHTHSIVSSDDDRIVVYNSGTSYVRDDQELAGCIDTPGDDRTALFSIDVIEIPVANPSAARIVDSPRVFARDGQIAGLWRGGDHGEGTQETYITNQCHDITVYPAKKIAAGACSGNGIVMDISNPLKPKRIADVTDKGFAYWHSATFNNDGTKVLFTDEWGGGGRPRCQASDPRNWGADAIYTIDGERLTYQSTYKLPAPQGEKENCVAHNGSIIPVPGRDIFVQAWYQGGVSVMDFTDPKNPFEIAYFDRGPIDDEQLVLGGYWSVYWYKGRIYATEITRGLDIFALEPSEFLSAEEIAAAEAAQYPDDQLNPQTQTRVTWPAEVLARLEASRKGG